MVTKERNVRLEQEAATRRYKNVATKSKGMGPL